PDDAYHVSGALRLRGRLREELLESSLGEIIRRHEALRTVFRADGDAPVQVVLPPSGLRLTVIDLTSLSVEEREGEAGRVLALETRRRFELENGPLMRLL